jgi:hypothetical protein
MGRHELAVEERVPARLHPRRQPCKRNLGRVRCTTEHAFAEEGPAKLHAIEAAHQLSCLPYLH